VAALGAAGFGLLALRHQKSLAGAEASVESKAGVEAEPGEAGVGAGVRIDEPAGLVALAGGAE
jgi:hypothetical protein